MVSDLSDMEGAMVEAMDMVLPLSPLFDDCTLDLVCAPGAGVYPLYPFCPSCVTSTEGALLFGITLPLMV